MRNSLAVFKQNIQGIREIGPLYDYLVTNIHGPMNFDDLLRSQIVYSVSAFDKLLHDIIRIGMVDIFIGTRAQTPKYRSEKIPLEVLHSMNETTLPPREIYFEQHLVGKLRVISFQEPDKVADGLSFIWNESNKWQKIAQAMSSDEHSVRKTLRLMVDRRNFIVHEADIDLTTGRRRLISKSDADNTVDFLEQCGESIVGLVV